MGLSSRVGGWACAFRPRLSRGRVVPGCAICSTLAPGRGGEQGGRGGGAAEGGGGGGGGGGVGRRERDCGRGAREGAPGTEARAAARGGERARGWRRPTVTS